MFPLPFILLHGTWTVLNLPSEPTLSLERIATFIHEFFLGSRVRVMWPGSRGELPIPNSNGVMGQGWTSAPVPIPHHPLLSFQLAVRLYSRGHDKMSRKSTCRFLMTPGHMTLAAWPSAPGKTHEIMLQFFQDWVCYRCFIYFFDF